MHAWRGITEEYRKFLPILPHTPIVTMLEGNTPLIPSKYLYKMIGPKIKLYFKYEGLNPTGSFKDRGMCFAVTQAVNEGSKAIICASTGNTSASAAAYAAQAGIQCFVLVPRDGIALGKLAQALVHGAKVLAVKGSFDDALEIVKKIVQNYPYTLVNSINPFRLEGQKTAAFEVCDQLGEAPHFHAIPVGNAGNITAYWMGFKEYQKSGIITRLPKMLGFQAEGAAPMVKGHKIDHPETIATAIKIGNPANWDKASLAIQESQGMIDAVSDAEILEAYKMLSNKEGIFCEPASATGLAGLFKIAKKGFFGSESAVITCTLTGHGLKDPDRAMTTVPQVIEVLPILEEVLKIIE